MHKPKILWLLNDWDTPYRTAQDAYGGIGYYRVVAPSRPLREWFDIDVVGADIRNWGTDDAKYNRIGRAYDLIISKHMRTGQEASNLLAIAKHFKKPILFDLDDNYLNIRKDNPAFAEYDVLKGPRYFVSATLELCDGVIVSTEPLKNLYTQFNKNIDVLPNCCDINDWPKKPKVWNDGKIRIGYAGGSAHNADLNLIIEPMAYILAKYPNVLFEIIGALTDQEAMRMGNRMNELVKRNVLDRFRIRGGTLAWQGYPELLASTGWDIILAPLVDDAFNRGKSHIRWLESSLVHAPVIASPVYPYQMDIQGVHTIQDGETGLFAETSKEWAEKLELLINDEILRKMLAKNAYNYVRRHWTYDIWATKWRDVFNKYLN